ncbi:MAG: PAS domain-containing protein [Chitinophagaceae bacterium]|nr:PAS domain-containing protein [Chitinophagaceae bacterium]MCA6445580.1 PAS domain-containing protein [Chitinophagaceae bacterium]
MNKESVEHLGIKSIIGIPLLFNDKVIGVLKFGTKNNPDYLNSLLNISKKLETFIGSEIQRKRIERDLSYLFDAIPDIISLSDLQGRILRINKTGSELIGYAEEEIINEGFEKFIHPDDLQIAYEELSKLGEGNNTFGFEVRFITKSGKTIWLSWYCKSNVKEGLIYATAKNITKEKYLSELNKQTRKLAKIGSWEVDLIKNEIYWSDEVYELHELDPNTFKPDEASTILFYKEEYRPIIESYVATAIQTGKSFDFEAIIVTAKKRERWVRAIGTTEFNNGKCIKIFGSFQDIHEKKMSEKQLVAINEKLEIQTKELQRSNEELEQFAFITSHDLQEPLRMISSYMDQLKRKYADKLDDKAIQYIYFATDGAKRMKEIILDLLAYSRANRPDEQKELLNLNEIVLEFSQLRRKLIAEKKASINSSKLPVINTYTAPITQIFHCLLDNALKYAKENVSPIIDIDVKETTDFWEFSITDNGIGIDPVFFEKIFILFQRLHNRKEYGGTGIGLSIAKRSVEFLGGKIWLSSEPNKGTTFYFTIPKN